MAPLRCKLNRLDADTGYEHAQCLIWTPRIVIGLELMSAHIGDSSLLSPKSQSRFVTILAVSGQPLMAVGGRKIPIAVSSPAPQHHGIRNRNTTRVNTLTFWGRPGASPRARG